MSKFKDGDRVVRIADAKSYSPLGYSCELTYGDDYVRLNGKYMTFIEKHWQLEERHPDHDLIIAWAKGAKIELLLLNGSWAEDKEPSWGIGCKHRIKPTPQTDAELIIELRARIDELEGEYGK